MKKTQSITSLPRSPEADRRDRMIKYALAMGIRLVCIIACLFVSGWWLVLCIVGAVVLPYVAVVLANVGGPQTGGDVERPGSIEVYRGQQTPRPSTPEDGSLP
jgi:predicted tellurium resistance membrane protein TerC